LALEWATPKHVLEMDIVPIPTNADAI